MPSTTSFFQLKTKTYWYNNWIMNYFMLYYVTCHCFVYKYVTKEYQVQHQKLRVVSLVMCLCHCTITYCWVMNITWNHTSQKINKRLKNKNANIADNDAVLPVLDIWLLKYAVSRTIGKRKIARLQLIYRLCSRKLFIGLWLSYGLGFPRLKPARTIAFDVQLRERLLFLAESFCWYMQNYCSVLCTAAACSSQGTIFLTYIQLTELESRTYW